jgi:hypothetical protein
MLLAAVMNQICAQTDVNKSPTEARRKELRMSQFPQDPPAAVLNHNADLIRQALPKGWKVEAEKSTLKIARIEPVEWYSPRPGVPDRVQKSQYVVTLDFAPPLGAAEVNRMKAENLATHRKLYEIDREISALQEKPSRYEAWRGYAPKSDNDRKLRAEYDRLKASLHRIPDFITADASVFVSQSVGDFTLFYSTEVEKECHAGRVAVEAVFVRQIDPSRADPGALAGKLADAVEARDEKGVLASFGVEPGSRRPPPDFDDNVVWVRKLLAVLRLRDAMEVRFGHEATANALTEPWLQPPDTKRLRSAHWIIGDRTAWILPEGEQALGKIFHDNRIGVGWDFRERRGWQFGIGIPASGETQRRGNSSSRQLTEAATKLSAEVKAGKYKSAEEVGEALRSMRTGAGESKRGRS